MLSVFASGAGPISLTELDSEFAAKVHEVGPISEVRFVGQRETIDALQAALGDKEQALAQRLVAILGKNAGPSFIAFDPATGAYVGQDWTGTPLSVQLIEEERRSGLTAIFQQSGGEERAPKGTHYAKTSTSHSDRFLRVSNVLERFENVQLVAFWLLAHLWKLQDVKHIVTDTSGIFSVLLEALGEARRLSGLSLPEPRLWSHRSHEGVADISRSTASAAVFVISASTSNRLARRLINRGVPPSRIVTLFELIDPASAAPIEGLVTLCSLLKRGQAGLEPIINHEASACPDCKRHFHLVAIRGDQFSIAPPRVTVVDIKAVDLRDEHKRALASLFGLRAFFAYRTRLDNRVCSLGIDVRPIVDGATPEKSREWLARMRTRWGSIVRRSATVTLRTVVAGSYPGSDVLAESIQREAASRLGGVALPSVVNARALANVPAQPKTSTVVVSACIDEHQELLSVSRVLRDVQEGGTTSYVSVVQLMSPTERGKRLKSNLTMGELGAETFSYFTCLELPVDSYEDAPSWKTELLELQRFSAWLDEQDQDTPAVITERIERLQAAPADGLVDDLFWPDRDGQPLKLRSDFTLVEGALREPIATQADLFAAICVVLTSLRNHSEPARKLGHTAYERAVLSPGTFDRYNDGVLQACILRAARPEELAFGACEDDLSEDMLRVLLDALPDVRRPEKSEAVLEFVLALLTGRMTLLPDHVAQYADQLIVRANDWPLAALLARYLRHKVRMV